MSDTKYFTEEPSSNDTIVIKPITITRTGDLSRNSVVRVSTSDNTALAGQDYKPKTEMITFEPGVSALDFDIRILYDVDAEDLEYFRVVLGPQDPVSAVFGEATTANVFIKDNGISKFNFENSLRVVDVLAKNMESSTTLLASTMSKMNEMGLGQPMVTSIKSNQGANKHVIDLVAGAPLICIHVNIKIISLKSSHHVISVLFKPISILHPLMGRIG